jgi:hypothetical protein
MSSSQPDAEAAEAERKSTLAESLKEGVAEIAVELSAKLVVETAATVISGAADVAASAGEIIIDCGSAVVEGIADSI